MTATEPGWVIFRQIDDVPPVPWANGAGTTRELVGYGESAALGRGTARWRLSIALLERVGAFSPLPGIDRTFLLVGGDATLSIDGVAHDLAHGDIVRFRGDQDAVLVALGAPCHAVNLMVERDEGGVAPRLTLSRAPDAQFAVALANTAQVARFDLLARSAAADPGVPLPAQAASLQLAA